MENASKALIIAGAILLAILLISLGILIFNQASSVVSDSGMTEAQKSTFNSKFQKYESSTGITGAQVKSLVNDVLANNSDDNVENDIELTGAVTLAKKGKTADTQAIKTNEKYTVKIEYANGLVDKIAITKNTTQ